MKYLNLLAFIPTLKCFFFVSYVQVTRFQLIFPTASRKTKELIGVFKSKTSTITCPYKYFFIGSFVAAFVKNDGNNNINNDCRALRDLRQDNRSIKI